MKISTKGRYGIRIMLYLALNNDGAKPLKEIAKNQELSEKYLEQIINPLTKAGLVHSFRGSQGGYALTKSPQDITAGDILRTLEGSLAPVYCVSNDEISCDKLASCTSVMLWKQIKDAVDNVVDNITLLDLVNEYNEKNGPDFYI